LHIDEGDISTAWYLSTYCRPTYTVNIIYLLVCVDLCQENTYYTVCIGNSFDVIVENELLSYK